MSIIPRSALPNVPMKRIHAHWTAGGYTPNIAYDKKAYHFLISGGPNPELVLGTPTIDKNSGRLKDGYSAHTLNANTDSISISCAGMAGAVESPFNPGKYPLQNAQFDLMCQVIAELCIAYNIMVSDRTTLSHAEVQPNLGIRQRFKWDFTRLPFDSSIRGAKMCGDYMRERIDFFLSDSDSISVNDDGIEDTPEDNNPIPEGALVEITASSLNFRSAPNGDVISSLPRGVLLRVNDRSDTWLSVETPMGYRGWVSKYHVIAVDGPQVESPTVPDRNRRLISDIRNLLDEYEGSL